MAGNVQATLSCKAPTHAEISSNEGEIIYCMFQHADAKPFWHQSPLPYLVSAVAFKNWDSSEKVARLIPLIFTLLAGFFLYRLLADLWDTQTALLGLFAFWASPPVIVFAMSNNHIVLSFATVLLSIYVWTKAFNNTSRLWMVAAAVSALLAMWTYWHAYFLPFFFAFAEFRYGSLPSRTRRALAWGALPFLSFAAFLLFQYQQNPDGVRDLLETALSRSGVSDSSWTVGEALKGIAVEISDLWHPVFLVVALAFIVLLFTRGIPLSDPRQITVLAVLAGSPVLYWFAMARVAASELMFNTLLAAPFLAICFARGMREILQARLAVFYLPVIALVASNVLWNADSWQSRLYNIYNNEGYEVATLVRQITKPGDFVFEDGHEIGPGRLMYYAPQRVVVKLPNFPAPPGIHPVDYIESSLRKVSGREVYLIALTTRTPTVISEELFSRRGLRLQAIRTYSAWTIFKIERVASKG